MTGHWEDEATVVQSEADLAAPPDTEWPIAQVGDPDADDGAIGDTEYDAMRDHDVIGAIRLARVAADGDVSFVRLVDRLLTYAPDTHPRAIAPTKLLVQAITDEEARISVPQL
jgi:hypothetical protein